MAKHNPHANGATNPENKPLTLGRLDTIHRQMARTVVSAPWATTRPRKVYKFNGIERYANGMINKNESNGPGRDATSAITSSTPARHLQINDKNITDHLHAKESPVARSNIWPNGRTDTDTRPSYSILHSTRLSKQDDTRALSHNTQLSIWRQGRLAGDLGLTKQTERSLVSYLRRFTPPNPVKDICH